jgi:hypothetical protein
MYFTCPQSIQIFILILTNFRLPRRQSSLPMSSISKSYLLLYNVLQSVGWAVALYQVIIGIKEAGSLTGAYATAGETVGTFISQCRNVP